MTPTTTAPTSSAVCIASPAKIILSGEHAVVHGCPALATAVDRFCHINIGVDDELGAASSSASLSARTSPFESCTTFHFPDLYYKQKLTFRQLLSLQKELQAQYQNFLRRKCRSSEVLNTPSLLTNYAYIVFLSRIVQFAELESNTHFVKDINNRGNRGQGFSRIHSAISGSEFDKVFGEAFAKIIAKIPRNSVLNISSNIPIGCGMGSSAALIVSLGKALLNYVGGVIAQHDKGAAEQLATLITPELFLDWARDIENLQHGLSSGLDLYLAYHGGGIWVEDEKYTTVNIPSLPLLLVNTGRSQVSTGECVAAVREYFEKKHLANDFTAVTCALMKACQSSGAFAEMRRCVRENHKLLCTIGVVPPRVQSFVAAVEKYGLAAKVSGAGAIAGESAGIVMIVGDNAAGSENQSVENKNIDIENTRIKSIEALIAQYGYEQLLAKREENGVRVLL